MQFFERKMQEKELKMNLFSAENERVAIMEYYITN